jgi:hypothetical protein
MRFAAANVVVALVFVPWLGVLSKKTAGVVDSFWISRPRVADLFKIPFIEFTGAVGIPSLAEMLSGYVDVGPGLAHKRSLFVVPMLLLSVMVLLGHARRIRWAVASTALALSLPIVVLFVLSVTVRPVLIPRAVVPATVGLVLFWGAGLAVRRPLRPITLVLSLVVLVELSVATVYFYRAHGRDPVRTEGWREASFYLQERAETGDMVIVWPLRGLYLLGRYDRSGKLGSERLHDARMYLTRDYKHVTPRLEAVMRDLPRSHTVWIIDHATWRMEALRETVGRMLPEIGSRNFTGVYVTEFGHPGRRAGTPVDRLPSPG